MQRIQRAGVLIILTLTCLVLPNVMLAAASFELRDLGRYRVTDLLWDAARVGKLSLTVDGFSFSILNGAGRIIVVEHSADLIHWVPRGEFVATNDCVELLDRQTAQSGFYRAYVFE